MSAQVTPKFQIKSAANRLAYLIRRRRKNVNHVMPLFRFINHKLPIYLTAKNFLILSLFLLYLCWCIFLDNNIEDLELKKRQKIFCSTTFLLKSSSKKNFSFRSFLCVHSLQNFNKKFFQNFHSISIFYSWHNTYQNKKMMTTTKKFLV